MSILIKCWFLIIVLLCIGGKDMEGKHARVEFLAFAVILLAIYVFAVR